MSRRTLLSCGLLASTLVLLAVLGAGLLLLLFMCRPATFLGRHWFTVQVALIAVPMAAVASWDLLRRDLVLAQWEGLHYLWPGIPVLLVTVGDHLATRADRAEAQAAEDAASGSGGSPAFGESSQAIE